MILFSPNIKAHSVSLNFLIYFLIFYACRRK